MMRSPPLIMSLFVLGSITTIAQAPDKVRLADSLFKEGVRKFSSRDSTAASLDDFQHARDVYATLPGQEARYSKVQEFIGENWFRLSRNDIGRKTLREILAFQERHPSLPFKNKAHVCYMLAESSRYIGALNEALRYSLMTMQAIEGGTDSADYDFYYAQLALVYQELGQTDKSIEWYKKTLSLREHIGSDKPTIFRTAELLAQELIKENKEDEAFSIVTRLEKKYPASTPLEKAGIALSLAYCYDARKAPSSAEKYYLTAIGQYEQSGITEFLDITRSDIGKFYIEQGQYTKAAPYLDAALRSVSTGYSTLSLKKGLEYMLFRTDSATGNYLSAIRHFSNYKAINDSLFDVTKSRQIQELQVQYETDKKDKDLALQQKDILLLTQRQTILIIGMSLLCIIVLLLYSRYRARQKSARLLEDKQLEIQDKNRHLEDILREKEWLLKEIHHRVKNNLQIIMSLLSSQSAYIDNDAALFAIRDSQHRVQAISLIHQKLYLTENVSTINMPVYIHELIQYLRDSFATGFRIRFAATIDPVSLDVSLAVPLGLILNEAITNSIKYAFPDQQEGLIRICLLQTDENHYCLTIADNGIGIIPDASRRPGESLGMSLMRGLTEELGGAFSIENDNGVLITIIFQSITHE